MEGLASRRFWCAALLFSTNLKKSIMEPRKTTIVYCRQEHMVIFESDGLNVNEFKCGFKHDFVN